MKELRAFGQDKEETTLFKVVEVKGVPCLAEVDKRGVVKPGSSICSITPKGLIMQYGYRGELPTQGKGHRVVVE